MYILQYSYKNKKNICKFFWTIWGYSSNLSILIQIEDSKTNMNKSTSESTLLRILGLMVKDPNCSFMELFEQLKK